MGKGIFITSLNSKRLHDAIKSKNDFSFRDSVDNLDVFVFDTFEVLNGIFFSDLDANKQKETIEATITCLEENFINTDIQKRELIRCSEMRRNLNPIIAEVFKEYYSNRTFENHCRNQVFQNLQPKLKKVNVTSNKSNLIEILVPFLIVEVAVYLFIYSKGVYSRIFGLEDEMDILMSIKSGKYPVFDAYLANDVDYIQIQID